MDHQLTQLQQKALACVMNEPAFGDFYLSGGTALAAFYEHHRVSDDLDFFTPSAGNPLVIEAAVGRLKINLGATDVQFQKVFDRRLYFFTMPTGEQLKLEFTQYPFAQLEPVQHIGGSRIDSLRDIAANKLMALVDRFDPKDFVDLYFLTRTMPLNQIRADAAKKFGVSIAPLTLGSELMKVERIAALPKMLKPLDVATLKEGIRALAKELKSEIIQD